MKPWVLVGSILAAQVAFAAVDDTVPPPANEVSTPTEEADVDAGAPTVAAAKSQSQDIAADAGVAEASIIADPTILALLLKKNILSMNEFEAASAGLPPPDEGRSPLMGKWAASLYGFVELDAVGDTTQSFAEQSANNAIARSGTYAGDHRRVTFGARNSRLGLKLAAPPFHGVKAGAVLEMDFMGNTPTPTTDTSVLQTGGPRFRHLALTLETPIVDILIGQWWALFGWQPNFFPTSVEIQGMAGQIYGRTPQFRVSHTFKTPAVNVEVAAAALKPVQTDMMVLPDVHAGVRVALNKLKGLRTSGSTGTRTDPMMFGLSAVGRHLSTVGLNGGPNQEVAGWGVSADVLVPLIAGSTDNRVNSLTLTGSLVVGEGINDLFSQLNGGVSFPTGFKTSLANGLVGFDSAGQLHAVQWRSYRVGLQYYLPPTGNIWVAVNYEHLDSPNAAMLGDKTKIFTITQQGDVDVFFNVTPALRFGASYVLTWQQYADGQVARNHRGIVSGWFLF